MKTNSSNVRNVVGSTTEKTVVNALRQKGYWVYNTPMKANGQPVDIIAIKGNVSYLMDAKHIRENDVSFTFNRVEPNQITTMLYAMDFAKIENLGFAILFERTGAIYWLDFKKFLESQKNGKKSININELELFDNVIK